jgi:hypothetical protein
MLQHFMSASEFHICSLLSNTSSSIAAVEFHKIIIIIVIKMSKYYFVFTIKKTPFDVTIFRAMSVCLWVHIQSLVQCCYCAGL